MDIILLFALPIFLLICFFSYVLIKGEFRNEEKRLEYIKKNLNNEFSLIRIKEERLCINNNDKSELAKIINEAIKNKIKKDVLCYVKITENDIIIVRYIDKTSEETIRDEEYTNYDLFLSMFEFI